MIEQELPHGNIEIPKHWNFPERNDPDLKVIQIDLDQSFLAFGLPKDPLYKIIFKMQREYRDYFFDHQGEQLDKREHNLFGIYISLVRGDMKASYRDDMVDQLNPSNSSNINLEIVFLKPETTVPRSFELGAGDEYRSYRNNQLGVVNYGNNELLSVVLGTNFIGIESEGNYLRSPLLIIGKNRRQNSLYSKSGEWKLSYYDTSNNFFPDITEGQPVVFYQEDREPIFRIEWGIEESSLSVSQTHMPTGIIKTLRAPLGLDAEKVSIAVFSKPPYPKDEKGRLVAPWRSIDQIVGASLSYSYPPDKQR